MALSLGLPPVAVSDHLARWSSDFPPLILAGRTVRTVRTTDSNSPISIPLKPMPGQGATICATSIVIVSPFSSLVDCLYGVLLEAHNMSGSVAHDLSGLWFHSHIRRDHETNRADTGDSENEI